MKELPTLKFELNHHNYRGGYIILAYPPGGPDMCKVKDEARKNLMAFR